MPPKVAPARTPGIRRRVEPERARDPDRAELLGEALQPAPREREVTIDPDERARRHLLAVEQGVDDDEALLVLRAGRVEQLAAARRSTTASRRRRARSDRDPDEGPDLSARPRRPSPDRPSTRRRGSRRRSARAGRGRARSGPSASAGPCSPVSGTMSRGSGGGRTWPRVSRLSRSYSIATGSKRKYDRGGSGPHVLDE